MDYKTRLFIGNIIGVAIACLFCGIAIGWTLHG